MRLLDQYLGCTRYYTRLRALVYHNFLKVVRLGGWGTEALNVPLHAL